MKNCSNCKKQMEEQEGRTPEGIRYHYYTCKNCGEEIVDMNKLHTVAEKYRAMKRFHAKISKWGMSLGLRIPKELVDRYHLKDEKEVAIIPEENGMRIIPA